LGFSIPIHDWVRGEMGGMVQDLLSEDSLRRSEVFDPTGVRKVLDDHFAGRRSYGFEIWGLAVLSAWIRCRIDAAPAPPVAAPVVQHTFDN